MAAMRRASVGLPGVDFFSLVKSHNTQEHFFELIFTLQSERLDDQRCSPPPSCSLFGSNNNNNNNSLMEEPTTTTTTKPPSKTSSKKSGKESLASTKEEDDESGLSSHSSSTKKKVVKPRLSKKSKNAPCPDQSSLMQFNIELAPYYAGPLTRGEAEDILAFYADGTYLLRKSGEQYVFCVRWSKSGNPGFVTHVRIETAMSSAASTTASAVAAAVSSAPKTTQIVYRFCILDNFATIAELIEYYAQHNDLFAGRYWINATQPPPSLVPYDPKLHASEIERERSLKRDAIQGKFACMSDIVIMCYCYCYCLLCVFISH
jgi:hypothetical protein